MATKTFKIPTQTDNGLNIITHLEVQIDAQGVVDGSLQVELTGEIIGFEIPSKYGHSTWIDY